VGLLTATGDLEVGLDEAAKLLGAVGRVLPAAMEPVVLKAESDGGEIEGQTAVMRTRHIQRVSLVPADPKVLPDAVEAVASADQVVLGPGSLYTSVLAAATVPGIREALRTTPARRVYVANLRPQRGETEGYDVGEHVDALHAHGIDVDVVLADTSAIELGTVSAPIVVDALAKANGLAHDPVRLATALVDLVG
jgi:uncharacterized cofD-like protein